MDNEHFLDLRNQIDTILHLFFLEEFIYLFVRGGGQREKQVPC